MDKSDCTRVGRILKAFGYKVSLIILFESGHPGNFTGMEAIFIETDDDLVPFFFEDFQVRDDHTAIVRLEGISSDEQAKKMVNYALYLPVNDPLMHHRTSAPLQTGVTGYSVHDLIHGYIGTVQEVITMKEQDLLKVVDQSKEVLIPAVDAFILRIDSKKKEIHTDLPEGLLDVNS